MWLAISVMICYKFPLTSEFMCYIYNICSFMFRYSGPTYFIMCFMLPNMWYNIPIVCFFNYQPIHLTTTQLQVTMLLPMWPSDSPQCGLCQAPTPLPTPHLLHFLKPWPLQTVPSTGSIPSLNACANSSVHVGCIPGLPLWALVVGLLPGFAQTTRLWEMPLALSLRTEDPFLTHISLCFPALIPIPFSLALLLCPTSLLSSFENMSGLSLCYFYLCCNSQFITVLFHVKLLKTYWIDCRYTFERSCSTEHHLLMVLKPPIIWSEQYAESWMRIEFF